MSKKQAQSHNPGSCRRKIGGNSFLVRSASEGRGKRLIGYALTYRDFTSCPKIELQRGAREYVNGTTAGCSTL